MTSSSRTRLHDPLVITDPGLTRIATLGPAGTSSEAAACKLAGWLPAGQQHVRTILHPGYEAAAAAVLADEADLLIVANAYADIATFYMDPSLTLMGAFISHTPEYGIAVPPQGSLPPRPRVATHRAPVPLIAQLMPVGVEPEIVLVPSTSAAAIAAKAGEVDCALTTQPAAGLHGLRFIRPTRTIEMLWSVFAATARQPSGSRRPAAAHSGDTVSQLDGTCV